MGMMVNVNRSHEIVLSKSDERPSVEENARDKKQNEKSFCQYWQNQLLGFWIGLSWVYRSLQEELTPDVLTILILPVCEHVINTFHLFSSLTFIIKVLRFPHRSCTYFIIFIPKYFILRGEMLCKWHHDFNFKFYSLVVGM